MGRLAVAAEAFGKGRETGPIKPEGASEVRQAAAAFNGMRANIRRFVMQRTEMLAGISHDLRTPLTRLRLGGKLVDAKGVSRLYRSRISTTALTILVLAAFVAIGSTIAVSAVGRVYLDLLLDQWNGYVFWLENLFS